MAIQQHRTRSGKNTYYRYRVVNRDTMQEETLCGKELYWDQMFHPPETNYEGIKGLSPDLSMGTKDKYGLYHLSCLCKEHALMFDKYFLRKLKKALALSAEEVVDNLILADDVSDLPLSKDSSCGDENTPPEGPKRKVVPPSNSITNVPAKKHKVLPGEEKEKEDDVSLYYCMFRYITILLIYNNSCVCYITNLSLYNHFLLL